MLRKLRSDDQSFLKEMVYVAMWDAPGEPRRSRKALNLPMVKDYWENWGQIGDFGLIAEIDGKSVGMAIYRLKQGVSQLHAHLPELCVAVDDPYQGQGIGHMLMDAIVKHAKSRLEGLRLGVHPKNIRAQSLYAAYGFVEYETSTGNYPQFVLKFDSLGQSDLTPDC